VACYKNFNIQFIVETHSEYLIRKLQYLIAKKEFESVDANMYYFYHPDQIPEGTNQIKKIEFEKSGILNETFGKGFFDEADNLALDLFVLNQAQKN
jgi:predicted ATPase